MNLQNSSPSTFGRKVLKGAAIVGFFTLIGKAMGLVQKQFIAHYFGTGQEADAFIFAFGGFLYLFLTVPQNLLSPMLPLFMERREKEGEEAAWKFAGTIGRLLLILTSIAVALGVLFAPPLLRVICSFKDEETYLLTVKLSRVMLPAVLLMSLFYFGTLLHNSYKRFAIPAFGDTTNKFMLLLVLFLFHQALGIRSLAVGVLVGALAALSIQIWGFRKQLILLRPRLDLNDPYLKRFLYLLPPILVSILVAAGRNTLDYKFASGMGPGLTASLNYARGLSDTLMLLVPAAIGVAIFPYFAELSSEGRREQLTDALMKSVRLMFLIFIPLYHTCGFPHTDRSVGF